MSLAQSDAFPDLNNYWWEWWWTMKTRLAFCNKPQLSFKTPPYAITMLHSLASLPCPNMHYYDIIVTELITHLVFIRLVAQSALSVLQQRKLQRVEWLRLHYLCENFMFHCKRRTITKNLIGFSSGRPLPSSVKPTVWSNTKYTHKYTENTHSLFHS